MNPNISRNSSPQLPAAAVSALRAGNKIEAIKTLRNEQNLGLAQAKNAVDNYIESQPYLKASLKDGEIEATWNVMFFLLVLVGLVIAVYYDFTQ